VSRIEKAMEKAAKIRNGKSINDPVIRGGPDKGDNSISKAVIDKNAVSNVAINSPDIITINDPDSPISEEYRNLKSMVVRLTKQKGFQNTLMVTSALVGEGKSITAINLAITLSQEYDHTVLLIDADLRNPSLHDYFNIKPKIGLSDYLVKGIEVEAALVKTGIGKLTFLPAGKKVKNPVELLSSNMMKEFINEISHRYSDRYIIIDTPPVLLFAETRSIGSVVDGTIFVVKEGMTSLHNIRDALDILKNNNVLGILYNNASIENLNGRYRYYYGQDTKFKAGA